MADIDVGKITEVLNDKADVDLGNANKELLLFVGMVAPFAGTAAPAGWLKCDGSAISRTTYAALFNVIGTTYGAGDGNSTFNLPTQSVLPLGTSAPVYSTKSNTQVGVNFGNTKLGIRDNGASSLFTSYANGGDGDYYRYDGSGSNAWGNLYASLSNSTGAKAIVCIKY